MTKSDKYWIDRSNKRMASYHKDSDEVILKITEAYDEAIKSINSDIENIFTNYQLGEGLTPAKAKRLLNSKIPNPLLKLLKKILPKIKDEKIRKMIITRLNTKAYRARITRLEALKESIYLNTRLIADVELRESRKLYVRKIDEAYYRNSYDIQKGVGLGFNIAIMPIEVVEEILKHPWSSKHYSTRVWHNVDTMANKLEQVILQGVMTGKSYRKMALELEEMSDLGAFAAERLIRTEMTYFTNQAELESYKECGIDRIIYVATLDNRTSKVCQGLDRKVILCSEVKVGVNYPPMHPFCRSTTRAYLGEDTLKDTQRRARDPETGKTYLVPGDMSYPEWKEKYVDKNTTINDKKATEKTIMRLTTKNGITVSKPTKHFNERCKERGISYESVKNALEEPLHIFNPSYDDEGRISQKFIGKLATVSINPDTGNLITVYKTSSSRVKKYSRGD